MLREKSAQGMPITVIVAAVIGLIIIVVIIALITGKLSSFSKGVDESNSCANACKALNKLGFDVTNIAGQVCPGIKLPGTFKEGSNCCCT